VTLKANAVKFILHVIHAVSSFMTSRWIIPTLLILAGIVRLWAVSLSNLPVGDEINGYIFNAQRFARNLWVPSLENFPLVSITYGVIIIALNAFLNTLAGVLASWILTVLSGVVTVYFLFKSAKYLNGGHAATVIAISLMVFPGVFFVFRGDLSLYFICLSALQFSLIRLLQRPSIIWGIVPGIIATIFYLSRSDGMFILILSLVVFTIAKRGLLRFVPVVLVIFACGVVVFLLIRYTTMGEFGKGPGTRALHAFYQAEGMHDGKGGSWHDYTARGIAKFGPPEKYRNSVMRLMLSHPGDVFQRAYNNLKVIKNYIGGSHRSAIVGIRALGDYIAIGKIQTADRISGIAATMRMLHIPRILFSTVIFRHVELRPGDPARVQPALADGSDLLATFHGGHRKKQSGLFSLSQCVSGSFRARWTFFPALIGRQRPFDFGTLWFLPKASVN